MSLNNFQYDALMRAYNEKQLNHKHEQDEHIRQAYDKIPRLQEIDGEIASPESAKRQGLCCSPHPRMTLTSPPPLRSCPKSGPPLLQIHGYPPDYLELKV